MRFLSDNYKLIMTILALIISILTFLGTSSASIFRKKFYSVSDAELRDATKRDGRKTREQQMLAFLSRYGVNYKLHRMVRPLEYRTFKLIIGLLISLFLIVVFIDKPIWTICLLGIGGFVFGWLLIDFCVWADNADDNARMLKDIGTIYNTLGIRLKTGMHISLALESCIRAVGNKRLKSALMELNQEMATGEAIEAIEKFRNKFNNAYIDQLAGALEQHSESDDSNALMDDLSHQMEAVKRAIDIKKNERIETGNMVFAVLVYVGVLALIFIAAFTSLNLVVSDLL